MDRSFGIIDLWLLPILLIYYIGFIYFFSKDKESSVEIFFDMIICFIGIGPIMMAWAITTTELAERGILTNVPSRVKTESLIYENNMASCPDGFQVTKGRRGSVYCRKELPWRFTLPEF